MLRLGVFTLLVLCLSVVAPCFADTFEVTFFADFAYSAPPEYIVNGSFVWDTTAETFSNIHITDNFGDSMPQLNYAWFAEAGNIYGFPVGTMLGWDFYGTNPPIGIQYSPGDHAFLGPQVVPQPGTYYVGLFFLQRAGTGDAPSSGSWVTVSPVATPEPASLFLLTLGFLAILSVIGNKLFCLHLRRP